jgi:hypothetical protein
MRARFFAIQLFFGMTFFLTVALKWRVGVTPGFRQQFSPTWLTRLPGGLSAVFCFLAILESVAVLGLHISLLTGELLPGKSERLLKLSLIYGLFVSSFSLSGRA